MIVCAAPRYLQVHGRPESIADLVRHQAILYSRSGLGRCWPFPKAGGDNLEVTPMIRPRMDDLEAIVDAALMGMGIVWLPYWLVRDRIVAGQLVALLPDEAALMMDSYALWLQTPHLPLRIRTAVDALAAELPKAVE
jgi:DNA-binding transcriptional LysR family regulator